MDCQAKAMEIKSLLLKIYRCKKDFELLVIDKMPKTRMGVYIVEKKESEFISNGYVLLPWRKSRFMNMPTIYMKQKNVEHLTGV